MDGIRLWFEPLLWIIGTITTLVAFCRLCKPIWSIFTAPKEFKERMDELDKKLEEKFESIDSQLQEQKSIVKDLLEKREKEDSITLSLLHDAIIQIYEQAKYLGTLDEIGYYRACELYKQNGKSEYIDGIMEALKQMHTNQSTNKENE